MVDIKGNEVTFNVNENSTNEFIAELSNFKIKDIIEDKISLQDYFMKFYKEDRTYGEVE